MGQLATHTGGIVRIHMSRPGAFLKNPIEFQISTGFLGICQDTILQRITTTSRREIKSFPNFQRREREGDSGFRKQKLLSLSSEHTASQ